MSLPFRSWKALAGAPSSSSSSVNQPPLVKLQPVISNISARDKKALVDPNPHKNKEVRVARMGWGGSKVLTLEQIKLLLAQLEHNAKSGLVVLQESFYKRTRALVERRTGSRPESIRFLKESY